MRKLAIEIGKLEKSNCKAPIYHNEQLPSIHHVVIWWLCICRDSVLVKTFASFARIRVLTDGKCQKLQFFVTWRDFTWKIHENFRLDLLHRSLNTKLSVFWHSATFWISVVKCSIKLFITILTEKNAVRLRLLGCVFERRISCKDFFTDVSLLLWYCAIFKTQNFFYWSLKKDFLELFRGWEQNSKTSFFPSQNLAVCSKTEMYIDSSKLRNFRKIDESCCEVHFGKVVRWKNSFRKQKQYGF